MAFKWPGRLDSEVGRVASGSPWRAAGRKISFPQPGRLVTRRRGAASCNTHQPDRPTTSAPGRAASPASRRSPEHLPLRCLPRTPARFASRSIAATVLRVIGSVDAAAAALRRRRVHDPLARRDPRRPTPRSAPTRVAPGRRRTPRAAARTPDRGRRARRSAAVMSRSVAW